MQTMRREWLESEYIQSSRVSLSLGSLVSRAGCDGKYDDNRLTFKLVMVRGTDDPDDGPGHEVHPPRVGKLHQLPGLRDEPANQIF